MNIPDFFLQLVVILFTARVLGELATRLNIPAVIGELFAGVLIGPSLLNFIEPNDVIKLLAEIGIILLLFEVGLETDINKLIKTGFKPFIVAVGGVIIPLLLGFGLSYYFFQLSLLVSLFIGSTLTATSIGITMRVLTDLKQQASEEAQVVLGAAVIDDIIGIILLSTLYQFMDEGFVNLFDIGKILLFICLFLILAPIIAKLISTIIKYYEKRSEIPGLLPSTIVSLILLFGWFAYLVGAPVLLGGFAAGLALSKQFLLPFGKSFQLDAAFTKKVEEQMRPIVYLFTPFFFVSIGLSLNFHLINWHSSFIWLLASSMLVVAIIGKLASGFFLWKEKTWVKWAIGIAMIPRGEVGLIFAEMGLESKMFNNDIYAAMIIVIAITTIFTPFVMRLFYQSEKVLALKKEH